MQLRKITLSESTIYLVPLSSEFPHELLPVTKVAHLLKALDTKKATGPEAAACHVEESGDTDHPISNTLFSICHSLLDSYHQNGTAKILCHSPSQITLLCNQLPPDSVCN